MPTKDLRIGATITVEPVRGSFDSLRSLRTTRLTEWHWIGDPPLQMGDANTVGLGQLSICLPRNPARVWTSFWSDSGRGVRSSPMSSRTLPIRSP